MFEFSLSAPELCAVVVISIPVLFFFCYQLYKWSWKEGYKVGKDERKDRRQSRVNDTQANVYGRIVNVLKPLQKEVGKRGVEVIAVGNSFNQEVYAINIVWTNDFCSSGILVIKVFRNRIEVKSLPAPCPQGTKISYTVALEQGAVETVISDARTFIAETYEMAHQNTRAR